MIEEAFCDRMRAFPRERRPDLGGEMEPTTQLWNAGHLGSFGLIGTLALLEEITGRPLQIGADDLPQFFAMKGIFEGCSSLDERLGAVGEPRLCGCNPSRTSTA